MPSYRFALHAVDERLIREEWHSLPTDEAAFRFAQALLAREPVIMVWRDGRFLRRVVKPDGA